MLATLKFDVVRNEGDSWEDGSWANKQIEMYLPDGSILGNLDLNYNTWTNTWDATPTTESNEGYNLNGPSFTWLGGGNYNSDGWVNESSRVDYAAGTTATYNDYYLDNDDTTDPASVDAKAVAYYTETHKNGRATDNGDGTFAVEWQNESSWDYVDWDDPNYGGQFLGGTQKDRGELITYDKDWTVISRAVDTSSLADVAAGELEALPTLFASAVKKTEQNWDQDYNKPADGTPAATSYDKFLKAGPENGEVTYYAETSTAGEYVQIGRVNKWSWFNDTDGNWGVGANYEVYNETKAGKDEWPWDWVGNSDTHSNNGEINTWSNYKVSYKAGDTGTNTLYTEKYLDSNSQTDAALDYYTEFNEGTQYDSAGNITWQNSSAWDYKLNTDGTFGGEFLGGKEVNYDFSNLDSAGDPSKTTRTYDKDWNVIGRTKDISGDVATLGDATNGLASLLDGSSATSFDFEYFDAADIIAAIEASYASALSAQSVTDAGDSEV